ncbi:MAG: class I SAM-dependent methyltransferase [Casimicrobiaceae bacterium]
MNLTPLDLEQISRDTLDDYRKRAAAFWEGTRDHDVSQNISALLTNIDALGPYRILDFGCGPGRDLATLTQMGHVAIGLEALPEFVEQARAYSGCTVWQQDFLTLDLPAAQFDGIFANASLFHVPTQELPRVLRQLRAALKPGGVLFTSNPHGNDDEGWSRGRFGAYHRLETWQRYLGDAGFIELTHYYRPEGRPREQQPWLASVWRAQDGAA